LQLEERGAGKVGDWQNHGRQFSNGGKASRQSS
jgi:hypothetical protein